MTDGQRRPEKTKMGVQSSPAKTPDGRFISWQALRPESRQFPGKESTADSDWNSRPRRTAGLDEEHALVIDHKKGIRRWTHPSARTMHGKVLFSSYATRYVINLRKKDGSELSGRSKRIQKAALDKLLPWFGETPMCDITEEFVNEWYAKAATRCVPPRSSTRSGCSSA